MNSRKTIWKNLKWLFLPVAFLVFTVFGLGINTAKAIDITDDFYTIDGSVINIATSTENTIMFCAEGHGDGFSFTIGEATSTNLLNGGINSNSISLAYLIEPTSGQSTFSLSANPYNDFKCFLAYNVDTKISPTITLIGGQDDWNSRDYGINLTINRENLENYLIFSTGVYNNCSGGATNASSTILTTFSCNSNWKRNILFETELNTTYPINQYFGYNTVASVLFYYLDIKEKEEKPEVYLISETQDLYLQFDKPLNYLTYGENVVNVLRYTYDTALFENSSDFLKVWYYETSTSTPDYLGVFPLSSSGVLGKGFLNASSTVATNQFSYYQVQPCQMNYPYACAGTSTVAFMFTKSVYSSLAEYNSNVDNNLSSASTTEDLSDESLVSSFFTLGVDFLTGVFRPFLFVLQNMFPFNLPFIFYDAWFDSAEMSLPDDITLFNSLDDNGNISLNLPVASGTPVVVFGPSLLLTASTTEAHYSSVRSFSTYLIWFLFAMAIFMLAKRIMNDLDEDRQFDFIPAPFDKKSGRRPITRVYRVSKGNRSKTYSARF